MTKETATLAPFDAADYLDSEQTIAEFLAAAAEEEAEAPGVFLQAVEAVAKARGMAQVAEASGLGRESLYKALAPGAQPRFDTVRRVLDALGVRLAIVPRPKVVSGRAVSHRPHTSGVVFAKKAKTAKVMRASAFKVASPKAHGSRRVSSRDSRKAAR